MLASLPSAPKGTALYVHVPFCAHKCPYCDFFSVEGADQNQAELVDTLLAEAEQRAPESPKTVFLGGGTPSYLENKQLCRLLRGLDDLTGFIKNSQEVTAECNPESLTREKAQLLREMGVNRLSVGVQSLTPKTLTFFERPHNAEQALAAIEVARDGGFDSFSVDVIHGAPLETAATFIHNLFQIIELQPNHVSAYGLTYEPGTPLYAQLERKDFEAQNEDQELENLECTERALSQAGMARYEVSNFSFIGHECLHNVNYWHNGPYVGLGPSAASHLDGWRFGNARSIARWTEAVQHKHAVPLWRERLGPRARLGETWWLGLRLTQGVKPATARETAVWGDLDDPAVLLAETFLSEGLLDKKDGCYRLTDRGRPLADHVGRRFLVTPDESQGSAG